MERQHTNEELAIIKSYEANKKSSLVMVFEKILSNGISLDGFKGLVRPHEVVSFDFTMIDDPTNFLVSHHFGLGETVAENLINHIPEKHLIDVIDYRWMDSAEYPKNSMLNQVFYAGKIVVFKKIIDEYLLHNKNENTIDIKSICNFFNSLSVHLEYSKFNSFNNIQEIFEIATSAGERVLSMSAANGKNETFSLSEKLVAVGSSVYDFLEIAIFNDDVELFKVLFNSIDKDDSDLFLHDINRLDNKFFDCGYAVIRQFRVKDKKTSLVEKMIMNGSYNILSFLKESKFDFNFKEVKVLSKTLDAHFDFLNNNIKDLLLFKIVDNVTMFGKSVSLYVDSEVDLYKKSVIRRNTKMLRCLDIFSDVKSTNNFLGNPYKIVSLNKYLPFCVNSSLLGGIFKLFPQVKKEKMKFFGNNLNIKETQIVISWLRDFVSMRYSQSSITNKSISYLLSSGELMYHGVINDDKISRGDILACYGNILKESGFSSIEIESALLEKKLRVVKNGERLLKI